MRNIVVGFVGVRGSGKSTLSRALADILNWPVVSFGDYVRKVAKERGVDFESIEVLQDVGHSLVEQGWEVFCGSVLMQAKWQPGNPLIIDGIRHEECVNCLIDMVQPNKLVLIYIDIDNDTQLSRLKLRKNFDSQKLNQLETHPTEIEVKASLKYKCDFVVSGELPIVTVTKSVISWLMNNH